LLGSVGLTGAGRTASALRALLSARVDPKGGHGLPVDLPGSLQSFPLLELHERRSSAGTKITVRLAHVEPSLVESDLELADLVLAQID
jgi:hypothetical protein